MMKHPLRLRLCWALCAISAIAVSGCSTTTPSATAAASSALPAMPPVAIRYAEGQEQALAQLKLQPALEAYWRTHSQRDWAKLYTMEHSPSVPLSEKFYIPYHAKAWPVLELKVLSSEHDEATGEVLLSQQVVYHNPDKEKPHTAYRQDKWSLVGAQWLHVVTDPMLTRPQPKPPLQSDSLPASEEAVSATQ